MNTVSLAPDGTLYTTQGVVGENVLRHLGSRLELDENVTLGSFLQLCLTYPVLQQLNVFIPDLLTRTSKALSETSRLPSSLHTKESAQHGFTHLELSRTIELIGYPGEPRIEIYTSLKGNQDQSAVEIKHLQLDSLIGVPIRLGSLRHIVFGDSVTVLECATVITLFECIDALVWELGFHATPQECQLVR